MPFAIRRRSPARSRSRLAGIFLVCGAFGTLAPAQGQSVQSLANAEVARRTRLVSDARLQLKEAEVLFDAGKTREALAIYRSTYESLPDVVMAATLRNAARDGFSISGVARARELAKEGRYAEANALLDEILDPKVAPKDEDALQFKAELANPDRWPPALTPEHVASVNQVTSLLLKAHSAREIGDHDRSAALYQDVLRIDPYNSSARRGMETVERHRSEYFDSARDHMRSKMLGAVDRTWEDSLPPLELAPLGEDQARPLVGTTRGGREALTEKLRNLTLSRIDFSNASLDETIEYLRVRSRDLDPTGRGIDFVVSLPEQTRNRPVSLNLTDVPFDEVLRYITEAAGATYRVEERAVRIVSLSDEASSIISKVYRVPPGFIETAPVKTGASDDPFASGAPAASNGLQVVRMGAKEFLEGQGVIFADGTGASFNAATNTLIVRNTPAQLETVDMLVEQAASSAPKVVRLDIRMMQIAEAQLAELGFDWLLGPFNVNSTNSAGNGGTVGNQNLPANFAASQFVPLPFAPVLGNPVTAGLRSSNDITSSDSSIDLALTGANQRNQNRSPGVLSLSGVFTQPQFQMVVRALDQNKGTDLMAAPSVVAKSGQTVSIRGVREMLYPSEFDPPQVPQQGNNAQVTYFFNVPLSVLPVGPLILLPPSVGTPPGNYQIVTGGTSSQIITPTTPTAFESEEVGTILEAEPVISDDGRSVELSLDVDHSDFDGFIDYGTPILVPTLITPDRVQIPNPLPPLPPGSAPFPFLPGQILNFIGPNAFTITSPQPNSIIQPVFSRKKTTTSVRVWDGATIVIAGLLKETTTDIEDKVPILGDIPYAGRLFRTKIKDKRRSQLLVFVTVNVLDPSGKQLHQTTASAQ